MFDVQKSMHTVEETHDLGTQAYVVVVVYHVTIVAMDMGC